MYEMVVVKNSDTNMYEKVLTGGKVTEQLHRELNISKNRYIVVRRSETDRFEVYDKRDLHKVEEFEYNYDMVKQRYCWVGVRNFAFEDDNDYPLEIESIEDEVTRLQKEKASLVKVLHEIKKSI